MISIKSAMGLLFVLALSGCSLVAARDEARQRIYERVSPSFWVKNGATEDEEGQVLGVCKKELHYASLENLEAKLSLFDACMHEHGYQRATAAKDH